MKTLRMIYFYSCRKSFAVSQKRPRNFFFSFSLKSRDHTRIWLCVSCYGSVFSDRMFVPLITSFKSFKKFFFTKISWGSVFWICSFTSPRFSCFGAPINRSLTLLNYFSTFALFSKLLLSFSSFLCDFKCCLHFYL